MKTENLSAIVAIIAAGICGACLFMTHYQFNSVRQKAEAARDDARDATGAARYTQSQVRDIEARIVALEACVDTDVKITYSVLKDGNEVGQGVKPLKEFLALCEHFKSIGDGFEVIATGRK
jgi:hypothetical protein